ncbi:hypothetical protein HII31_05341 [Pseudocercospora fuligena]|uniref:Ankyrin repeat protein n=1 Tax=Pseudocercospora fuligena TaxID=685502 RepID=A0A8H6VK47_9PEZI|nr:hypothetical protein HII31_05341 [Pseudocercospora fuligena]
MAASSDPVEINLPQLPADHDHVIEYLAANKDKPMLELLEPYKHYDNEMRKVFAQQPNHPAATKPSVLPLFAGHEQDVRIRARDLKAESQQEQECFIMPLKHEDRRANGSPAVVQSLKEFRTNFNVFSESSLVDMNWDNVVVAGSAVVTSLLAVPKKHGGSKRALRNYYHEQLAPASDVDLFLYGLTEAQATEKIKQIEKNIRDAILVETTTVRTKNAITIASQYPTRHVQIVLRIYKSIPEILTGFDVDCSCAAYDGKQVYLSPRALAAYMTQINSLDLTRRSPSYENRLSKYAHRGFEVYWPNLDRSKIDPTIYERSFGRTEGLARLLILEKLPKSADRDAYLDQRRAERGRPAVNRWRMKRRQIHGNIKNDHEDEVAEWVDSDEVSDYHTFTIPYGPKFHARKIEKLLYTKDLLLNSEWNKPKDREVNLHRHPAFFGRAKDVFQDCCGYCPVPSTMEEEEVAQEEGKIYVSGEISYIEDDPGRQAIGSFNPLTAEDWTDMAYVGNTAQLCKAIVEGDSEFVRSWLLQEGNDPNTRDYTGRTPLHLAAANSSVEIVQLLIDSGARMVARLVDGKTALHLAAMRGSVEIVSALLRKSEANEEEAEKKTDARRAAHAAAKDSTTLDNAMSQTTIDDQRASEEEASDVDMMDDSDEDEDMDATTENSIVNIKKPDIKADDKALEGDDEDEPDVYDVNVLAWDTAVSPLHLAIVNGHIDVVKTLVQEFGADVLLPIKIFNDYDKSARAAILTMALALQLPLEKAQEMTRTLISLGASTAQADISQNTALQYTIAERPEMVNTLLDADKVGFDRAVNHLSVDASWYSPSVTSPLMNAIQARDSSTALFLLLHGSKPEIDFSAYMKAYQTRREPPNDSKRNKQDFEKRVHQPVLNAVHCELPELALELVEKYGVEPNTLSTSGWTVLHDEYSHRYTKGTTLLDDVRSKIKELAEWKPSEDDTPDPPIALQPDTDYLAELQEGSYMQWSAQKQLEQAKKQYKRDLKNHEESLKRANDKTGLAEKQAAIHAMADRFKKLEQALLSRQAKTFAELHPDVKEPDERDNYNYHYRPWKGPKPKPFKVAFSFQLGNLTDEVSERYIKLFEATWYGNTKAVKELTLTPWKNGDGDDQPPLQIAVLDQHSLSPFAIAVLHGQFELASVIMEIAKAQFAPLEDTERRRFGIDGEDDSDSESDDQVKVYSELVDQDFTIDTIGKVSTQVKSRVTPLTMLQWNCPADSFMGGPLRSSPQSGTGHTYFGPRKSAYSLTGKRTNTGSLKASSNHISDEKRKAIGSPRHLIQFALHNDDLHLLTYLLSLGEEYTKADVQKDSEDAKRFYTVNTNDFLSAIKLDRPHLVAEIIKHTGAGIPIDSLIKKTGIEAIEKPKYYQGLSVYGKKRRDWADAGRGGYAGFQPVENHRPPMLEAAYYSSLETVEWFFSDAPMRSYQEFAAAHKDDKRVQLLSEAQGGFEQAVSRFLSARSKLAIHCCLLGKQVPETSKVLAFLVKAMPDAIDHKNAEGITPLHIAFRYFRDESVKLLIKHGADQTARDKCGNNIVHNILKRVISSKKLAKLPVMLDLIDPRLLPTLFSERCSDHPGSLTPLADLIDTYKSSSGSTLKFGNEALHIVLKYSKGEELNTINGEGHAPIHVTVRENNLALTRTLLDHDPTLLLRENATGRTPFEMAEDRAISNACCDPPALPGDYRFDANRAKQQGLPHDWKSNMINRDPKSFTKDAGVECQSDAEKVWDLLKETKAKLEKEGHAKRRLVTLNEANEVARRLAANKSGHSRILQGEDGMADDGEDEEEQADAGDEVQLWISSASSELSD